MAKRILKRENNFDHPKGWLALHNSALLFNDKQILVLS